MAELIASEALRKARYFLERARQTASDPGSLADRLPFVANLEAAIVYGRSSLDHLHAELAPLRNEKGYRRWHDDKLAALKRSSVVFKEFADRRNVIVHEAPEKTRAHASAEAHMSVGTSVSVALTITRADGTIEHQELRPFEEPTPHVMGVTQGTTSHEFFFADANWAAKPAVSYVEEFVADCERFVVEAEKKFS